jgi:murein DD-endopeptidase MepM/ murein hydrolase activator NlpD
VKDSKVALKTLIGIMTFTTALLLLESYYLYQEHCNFCKLKGEYNNCVVILKKAIAEYELKKKYEFIESNHKKKKEVGKGFNPVNRNHEYRKAVATEFARQHNLENAIKQLYEETTEEHSSSKFVRKKGTKKSSQLQSLKNKIPRVPFTQRKLWNSSHHDPLFMWPIERDSFWLSSPFGMRKRKSDGSSEFHPGIDMAALHGVPVRAAASGVVIDVIDVSSAHPYGNAIVITHDRKFKTRYAHLSHICVKIGDKVDAGTIIGKVGSTGNVRKRGHDASHLHFEVMIFGKHVNPLNFL